MRHTRTVRRAACLAAAVAMLPAAAFAQAWPTKQAIKAIVPLPPATTTDSIGRLVMEEISRQIGQAIVVENRPGASTTLGTNQVAKAEPDGYTLAVVSSSLTVTPHTFANLPFNTETDLAPVAILANMANVLVVNSGRPYKTAKDLVDEAKKNPGKLNYASIGPGSAVHLTAERFRLSADFQAVHVPFKGTAEALTEVVADRIDFTHMPILSVVPFVSDGKLRALAVSTAKRAVALPNVPSSEEAGYKDSSYDLWIGVMLPGKTPPAIVERLHAECMKALDKPELAKKLADLGVDQMRLSPAEFGAMIKREIQSNAVVVKAAGLKPN